MPSLKLYAPSQTELPKMAHRRVWAAPDVLSHAIIVLTPARLYLAPGQGPVNAETVKAVENGADVEQLFGSLTVAVNLPTVVRAVMDLPANAVHVEFARGADRPGTSRVSATFADSEAADGMFTKLWRRLGDGWNIRPVRPAKWDRLIIPAAVLAGILLVTAVIGLSAALAQDSAPGTGGIFRFLDWRWICGLGGILAAVAQVWLYRRATQPPAKLELVRG
ncbi:MAG TPA: hypothetical protein VGJ05_17620 [Fimbriiglobus sp.]|jgi:hypothetical protein